MSPSVAGPSSRLHPEHHACCLYESEAERRRNLTRFLLEGVERGQRLVCASFDASKGTVLQDLRDAGVDPGPLVDSGQLTLTSSHAAYLEDGRFSTRRALNRIESLLEDGRAAGFPGVRITGDLHWFQEASDAQEAFFEYESEVNRILRRHGGSALCLYDRHRFSTGDLIRCLSLHSVAVVGDEEVPNPYFIWPDELKDSDPISAELAWRRRATEDLKAANAMADLLGRTQARFHAVAESISDALLTIDEESEIVYANPAAHRMIDVPEGELEGHDITELMPEGVRERHVEGMARYMASGKKRMDWRGVMMPVLRSDGTRLDGEISFGEYEVGGHRYFTGVIRDVTERNRMMEALRRSGERLQAVFDAAPVAILAVDLEGRIQEWSAGATRIFGWTEEEAVGRVCPTVAEEGLEDYHAMIRRAVGEGTQQGLLRLRMRKSGEAIRAGVSAAALRDAQGEPVGVMIILEDVTVRGELEAQLRQARKMEAVGRLAGGVAHDFNNLLTVVGGNARIVLDSLSADAPVRQEVEEILGGVDRAASLTRQLMAFSRSQVLREEVLDLSGLVAEMEPMLRRLIPSRIDLSFLSRAPTIWMKGDANQLHRVLLNLALNAVDAIQGSGRITFELDTVTLSDASIEGMGEEGTLVPGRYLRLTVTDTGMGMTPEVQERIFDPFFTTKPEGRGTGLGLSTAFGIVKQIGGHVEVESAPGKGTTFRLLFPEVEDGVAPDTVSPASGPQAAGPKPPRRGATILLVEDEPSVGALIRRVLERNGHAVLHAASGAEAAEIAKREGVAIDLVLSDVVLSGTQGPELAQGLRKAHPHLDVVLMSGYAPDHLPQTLHGRRVSFLAKPFSPEELLQLVDDVLDG